MIIKVRLKTPSGHARQLEKKVGKFIIPIGVHPISETNEDDSQIIWTIDDDPRKVAKVIRNVAMYDTIIDSIMGSSFFKRKAKKRIGDDGMAELEDMLKNQTTCELVKSEIHSD